MNPITVMFDSIKERREAKRLRIASPYLTYSVGKQRELMLKSFTNSRKIERMNILNSLESIKYKKPWLNDKEVSDAVTLAAKSPEKFQQWMHKQLDQAFELAVHEAIAIVSHELRD